MSALPRFSALARRARIVPVVTIDDVHIAAPLARALHAGGIDAIEITLRTEAALRASEIIAREVPEMLLGIGTILAPSQAKEAKSAGARFLVTPGTTETLAHTLIETGLPALPGAASVSEMVRLLEWGFHELKFFPASAAGGIDFLKSVAGPLPQLAFCPTGGISAGNAGDWLALPNVLVVGGSWLAPKAALQSGDFAAIEKLAAAAARLGPG